MHWGQIGDRSGMGSSLNNLGDVAFTQGDYAAARNYLEESLTILKEIGKRSGVRDALEAFATLAARNSGLKQAAMLWAAAEVLREEIGSPLPSNAREQYDRDVAGVREALGKEVFSAVWQEGRVMTMEQAIEFALGG